MKLSNRQKAVLALILSNIIWGAAFPIYKWSLSDIGPYSFAFLRFFIASLLLYPFVIKRISIESKDILRFLGMSLVGLLIAISCLFLGLQRTNSINAPVIISTGPLFLLLASSLFLHEKLKRRVMIGTLISLCGVLIVVVQPVLEHGIDNAFVGNLFFLVATIASIGHTVLLKPIGNKYHPVTLTFWTFLFGSLFLFPLFFMEATQTNLIEHLNCQGYFGIFYASVFSSVIAYLLFTYGLRKLDANETGVFSYIDPFITILVAVPLLGESLTWPFVIGGFLAFFGMFMAEGRFHYKAYIKALFEKRD